MDQFFAQLDDVVAQEWKRIKEGKYWKYCSTHVVDKELYRTVMEQIYHYTRYNSINQAAAALRAPLDDLSLLRFVYKHATEELGHDNMVVRDLRSVGIYDADLPTKMPLPPTRALIAYLNDVAIDKGPIARLGYSYWAESVYDHIQENLEKIRSDLRLTDRNLTFFVAHSSIDERHSKEVREALEKSATTDARRHAVIEVAETTLYLTGQILDRALDKYLTDRELSVRPAA